MSAVASVRAPASRRLPWRRIAAFGLPVVALGALCAIVVHRRDVFLGALDAAPVWLLACAVALQIDRLRPARPAPA